MNQFKKHMKTFLTFRWQPGQDILVALVSLVLSAISWLWLVRIPLQPGVSLLPQILANVFMLWEPFFVFGWLQLRFERAFGILPGILLAGIAMGTYHLEHSGSPVC